MDTDTDTLVDSVNESAKHVATLTITFLAACLYIAIAVAATTHEALLDGADIDLPLLSVKVPITNFYILAPFLLVVFHLHLLAQEYFLFCKMEWLESIDPTVNADRKAVRFFPALAVNSYFGRHYRKSVRRTLRALRFLLYYVLPLALLCWIQARFLPYHSAGRTFWHQLFVLLDVTAVAYYGRKLSLLRKVRSMLPRAVPPSLRRVLLWAWWSASPASRS